MPAETRKGLSSWALGALALGAFAVVLYAEHRRPLRTESESKLRRDARNMAVAGLSAVTLQALERPVVEPLARMVGRQGWGLVPRLGLPAPLETAASVLLLDYTLYLWHVWTHRSPFLWRFHAVHHVDLDCSATTALRFHFAEMAISVPYRAAQVVLIGTSLRALTLWQRLVVASIVFHHSNLRLPDWLEERLVRVIVTPHMHGIHHSVVDEECNSNWSSGLTIWDRLHGTLRLDVRDRDLRIGVPGFDRPEDVTFPKLLAQPFHGQPSLPGGSVTALPSSARRMAGTMAPQAEGAVGTPRG